MNNPFDLIDARLSNIETLLLDIKHCSNHPQHMHSDRWMNINELCEYLPDRPAKATVYGWAYARTIPVHKGGKKLRFLKSEIDEWLLQGRKQTKAEMIKDAQHLLKNKGGKNR